VVAVLGVGDDLLHEFVARLDAARAEPKAHVGGAGHRADFDLLLAAEHPRGHARVDAIGQPLIALVLRFDDRGGVHARARAKRVRAHEGVVDRDGKVRRARDGLAVLEQLREVLLFEGAGELEVQEQQLHRGVADALADAEARPVNAIGAVLDGEERVDEAEAAVVVPVPVDLHVVRAHALHDRAGEVDEVAHAVGRGVTDGVAEAQALGPVVDGVLE